MKYLLILLTVFVLSCENTELIKCQQDSLVTRDSLNNIIAGCETALIECKLQSDTLKENWVKCQFDKTVLEGKVTTLNGSVKSLKNEIKLLKDANYIISKEGVNSYLASVQTQITEAEKALFELGQIVEVDVSEAVKVTTANLNFLKGQRKSIGDLFGIQVESR